MQTLKNLGFLLIGLVALGSQGCFIDFDDNDVFGCTRGEGSTIREEITLSSFHSIDLTTSADVFLRQGPEQEIEVEGQANIIDLLNRNINGGTWRIDFDDCITSARDLKIFITIPDIESISISGSGDVFGENEFTCLDLELRITGSGDMDIFAEANSFDVRQTGSGDMHLEGFTNELDLVITGSGDFEGFLLESVDCDVTITGSGNAEVFARDNLNVRITGSGDVYYKGNPMIDVNITGSGSLVNAN
jgi:hypothetical protein